MQATQVGIELWTLHLADWHLYHYATEEQVAESQVSGHQTAFSTAAAPRSVMHMLCTLCFLNISICNPNMK